MINHELKIAKNHFYKKEYDKALELFLKNKEYYEAGLCYLLMSDENNAKNCFKKNEKISLASSWGLILLDLINLKTKKVPTFFQTRAFLEVYLDLFLKNNQLKYAQNLINCGDFLFQSNPEVYKFLARALYSNRYFDLAIEFCNKSLMYYYNDPEAMLILSQCYFLTGNRGDALDYTNKILYMVNDYYPAKLFRQILMDEINKK